MSNYDVFVSHSSGDKEFVRRLRTDLEVYGCHVWLDESALQMGGRLSGEIEDAIGASKVIVTVYSTSSIRSEWFRKEREFAAEVGIPEIPVVLDGPARKFVGDRTFADFREMVDQHKYHRAFHDVLRGIGVERNQGSDLVIYSSGLAVGWLDSSWQARCVERFSDTASEDMCYRADLEPFGGVAFVFRSGISTSIFDHLHFSIRGGGAAKQLIKVFFNDRIGNGIRNQVSLRPLNPCWRTEIVSLKDLDVSDTVVFKVNWSHAHEELAGPIFINGVRLCRSPHLRAKDI